jgi:hypothetical protein
MKMKLKCLLNALFYSFKKFYFIDYQQIVV